MNCPLKSGENAGYLLDYASGKLTGEVRAQMAEHIVDCAACRAYAGGQETVWKALDGWEPAAVSMDFDRRLYRRIAQEPVSWWSRLTRPVIRHALPIGATAGVMIMASMLMNRPAATPAPAVPQTAQVETLAPEQMQVALDDMEMLQEFSHLVPDHADPKM